MANSWARRGGFAMAGATLRGTMARTRQSTIGSFARAACASSAELTSHRRISPSEFARTAGAWQRRTATHRPTGRETVSICRGSKYSTLVGARVLARVVVVRRTADAHYLQPIRADHVSLMGIGPRRRAASPSISGHRLCGLHRGQSFAHVSAIVHRATRTKSAALSC